MMSSIDTKSHAPKADEKLYTVGSSEAPNKPPGPHGLLYTSHLFPELIRRLFKVEKVFHIPEYWYNQLLCERDVFVSINR